MSTFAPESVAPTRIDPVAASASEIIGGTLGRHASLVRRTAGSTWQPAAAVLAGLASVTVALGVLQKGHCLTKGWSNPDQFWHACYSDLPVSAGIGHALPYLSGAPKLDQPLISGLVMWLVGLAVPDGSALARQQWYFALWAVLITVIVMALVIVTAASVPRAPWRAAHVALSPVLVLVGLVSVDLLGVLLTSVALWAWGRSKLVVAGVVMGLATSARSYPLVLLVAIGLLAVRSGRVRAWAVMAGTALAAWFLVSLPWLVLNADGLLSTYRAWWRGASGYGSLWMVSGLFGQSLPQGARTILVILSGLVALEVGALLTLIIDRRPRVSEVSLFMLVIVAGYGSVWLARGVWGHALPQGAVTTLVILGWLAALLVGAFFALGMVRRPTVAEVSLVMLVIVVITGKTVPVQAALWLLPLIALVGLRWRDHLIWAGVEATYFVGVWLYIAGLSKPDRGLPSGLYGVLIGVRIAAWLYLLVQVWRVARSRAPITPSVSADQESAEHDGVRESADPDHEIDPLAGPMKGAPDHLLVRLS